MSDDAGSTFRSTIAGFVPYVVTGVSVVLLLGAAGFLAWNVFGDGSQQPGSNETLRFISLLIMLMVALGATAALFVSLRMGNADEPFGLPSGSIRALLALGIMMLFVVFGIPVITPQDGPVQSIDARARPADLASTVEGYRKDGFVVIVRDPGAAAAVAPGGATTTPERLAEIRIVGRLPNQSVGQLDLTKQLLTAIITLLTTVIGFYFGSRSTTDVLKQSTDGGGPATTLSELRKQIDEGFTPLKTEIAQIGSRIDRVKALGDQADPLDRAAIAGIESQRTAIEAKRDEAVREVSAADRDLASLHSATAEERGRHESSAREHLRLAGEALRALRELLPSYRDAAARF